MARYTFKSEDVEPLLEGLAIFGTGGGGAPAWGQAILKHDFSMGRKATIVSLDDIADDSTVVCGGIMGSVKILEAMGIDGVVAHWEERFELLEVTRVMESVLGRHIDYVVPFEVGGLNTPVMLTLAARMGIAVLDGDALGRSAPETQMTSFIGHGIDLTPMPLIDFHGNVVIVQRATQPTYPDQLGRYIVTQGGGLGANNHYPMTGRQAKQAVIPNTISRSLQLGRVVLDARRTGADPVGSVAHALGGVLLHAGEIISLREEESMGFYFTTATIAGAAAFAGHSAELVIKNETMMLSVDGKPKAYFPDLVLLLEPGTARGIMSVELKVGSQVALVGVPCHPRLREAVYTPEGRVAFSPARYGRGLDEYQPMEDLVPALRAGRS
jgi:uncharacterized protein